MWLCFFVGFVVAFAKGAKLIVVMVATMPLIIILGSVIAKVMSKMSSKGQEAYVEAGTIVEQVVSSI